MNLEHRHDVLDERRFGDLVDGNCLESDFLSTYPAALAVKNDEVSRAFFLIDGEGNKDSNTPDRLAEDMKICSIEEHPGIVGVRLELFSRQAPDANCFHSVIVRFHRLASLFKSGMGRLLISHSYAILRSPANPATCLLNWQPNGVPFSTRILSPQRSPRRKRGSPRPPTDNGLHRLAENRGISDVSNVFLPYSLKMRRELTAYGGSR